MRHLPFLLIIVVYVLVIGQNWGHYSAALMMYVYNKFDGRWSSVPFKL